MYPRSPELSILHTLTCRSLDKTRLEPQWLTLIQIWRNQEIINTTLSAAFEISNLQARYKPKHFYTLKMREHFCCLAKYFDDYLYYVDIYKLPAPSWEKRTAMKKKLTIAYSPTRWRWKIIFSLHSPSPTRASFSHYSSLSQAVFSPLHKLYRRFLCSMYTSHSCALHVQAAPSVL